MTTEAKTAEEGDNKPLLRIDGLHIEGFRAIHKLQLPQDGLGWKGQTPDIMLIGGINGSGKTTLLDLLFANIAQFPKVGGTGLQQGFVKLVITLKAPESSEEYNTSFSLKTDEDSFLGVETPIKKSNTFIELSSPSKVQEEFYRFLRNPRSNVPHLIYIPSNERSFSLPPTPMKKAGKLTDAQPFAYRWDRPKQWEDSLEALLYAARWEDLNAKEEGRPEEAVHFAQYSEAFDRFFERKKSLVWRGGELFVEIANTGQRHSLEELSSGEKQLLILVSELFRRWKPGSLLLIDEPELHLHTSWQTRLYQLICELQAERGGQVIMATQSNHLFQLGEPGTKLLLGGKTLA